MPNRKRHRIIVWVVFLSISVVLAFQIGYPQDCMVPFARLAGKPVGWQKHETVAAVVTKKFESTRVGLKLDGHITKPHKLSSLGAELQAEQIVAKLENYPFWQRFIPLSLLWQHPVANEFALEFNPKPLNEFATLRSKELSFAATDASLELKDGTLVATDEKMGRETSVKDIQQAIKNSTVLIDKKTVIFVDSKRISPKKTSKDFANVKTKAEQALARPLTLVANQTLIVPTLAEKASWLKLADNGAGSTSLVIDMVGLGRYLDDVSDKHGVAAGQTRITMVNGIETGRQVGAVGRKVDADTFSKALEPVLLGESRVAVLTLPFVDVAPTAIYNGTYTATRDGLQAYVNDQARRGAWFSIRQIGGEGWSVDADATESIPSASTYKVFVAKILFDKMNAGEIRWNDSILDTSVSGCFDRMTIASTNPCAQEWLRRFGRTNVNEHFYSLGFSRGTNFMHPAAVHTTAADLTKLMVGIENSTYISGANRERLFRSLGTHPYRYGIPTGSKGRVYDKVGFLWDYVHDTAIVYHPRGTYVMTIMTKGQSYAAIARMTRQIEALMYP